MLFPAATGTIQLHVGAIREVCQCENPTMVMRLDCFFKTTRAYFPAVNQQRQLDPRRLEFSQSGLYGVPLW
jgi:hypothetical protein